MKTASWVLAVLLAVFFVAFGLNKFFGFLEGDTEMIFAKSGELFGLADFFRNTVIYIVGAAEVLAGVLILSPRSRRPGALLGLAIVAGALFFHMFSPLGIEIEMPTGEMRQETDFVTNTIREVPVIEGDGGILFITAVIVFVLCATLFFLTGQRRST